MRGVGIGIVYVASFSSIPYWSNSDYLKFSVTLIIQNILWDFNTFFDSLTIRLWSKDLNTFSQYRQDPDYRVSINLTPPPVILKWLFYIHFCTFIVTKVFTLSPLTAWHHSRMFSPYIHKWRHATREEGGFTLLWHSCSVATLYAPIHTVLPFLWEHFILTHATYHTFLRIGTKQLWIELQVK